MIKHVFEDLYLDFGNIDSIKITDLKQNIYSTKIDINFKSGISESYFCNLEKDIIRNSINEFLK